MKETKFKIWNLDKKRWEDVLRWAIAPEDGSVIDADEPGVFTVAPFSYEIVQYTGLKDKNGKEIYEGDIVERDGFKFSVDWEEIGYNDGGVGYGITLDECKFITVIGNVYENPELLNK